MSANIDSDELEKFASRSDQWWDASGEFKTLHDINPVRLHYVNARYGLEKKQVLDVGCGGGILSEAMAKMDAFVTAIDASDSNIQCALTHAKQAGLGIDYLCCTAEDLAEKRPQQFDVVTCMELLEHVPDPVSLIRACARLVKPGGHVIFSTINRQPKAYLLAVLAGEYLLKLLPRGTHDYRKFIRPAELVNWCREAGLLARDIRGLDYNPVLNRCTLTTRPDVNYLIDTLAE